MNIQRGDQVTILCNGHVVKGIVLTAINYAQEPSSDWYIELTREDGGYGYWKQGIDGGEILTVYPPGEAS